MIASTRLHLELPVNPIPLERPRSGRGRVYTPKASAEFKEAFGWSLREAGVRGAPPTEDLAVTIRFWRNHPGGTAGDVDNLAKAVLDAGNGFLWADDRQIRSLTSELVAHGGEVDGRIELDRRPWFGDRLTEIDYQAALTRLEGWVGAPAEQIVGNADQWATELRNQLAGCGVDPADPATHRVVVALLDQLALKVKHSLPAGRAIGQALVAARTLIRPTEASPTK